MTLRRTFLVIAGLAAVSACGGSSVSSDSSNPNSIATSSTVVASPSGEGNQVNTESPGTSVAPVAVAVDPENLLIDSSLDIAAIDGPVVLWFWAPG